LPSLPVHLRRVPATGNFSTELKALAAGLLVATTLAVNTTPGHANFITITGPQDSYDWTLSNMMLVTLSLVFLKSCLKHLKNNAFVINKI
jgi:hypothetical protein